MRPAWSKWDAGGSLGKTAVGPGPRSIKMKKLAIPCNVYVTGPAFTDAIRKRWENNLATLHPSSSARNGVADLKPGASVGLLRRNSHMELGNPAPKTCSLKFYDDSAIMESCAEIDAKWLQTPESVGVPSLCSALQSLRPWAYRADLWRYAVLWMNGGIYFDLETRIMRPLSDFFDLGLKRLQVFVDDSQIYHGLSDRCIWQAILASEKGNPALAAVLRRALENVGLKSYGVRDSLHSSLDSLGITGPCAMSRALMLNSSLQSAYRVAGRWDGIYASCRTTTPTSRVYFFGKDFKVRMHQPGLGAAFGISETLCANADHEIGIEEVGVVGSTEMHYSAALKSGMVYSESEDTAPSAEWKGYDLDPPLFPHMRRWGHEEWVKESPPSPPLFQQFLNPEDSVGMKSMLEAKSENQTKSLKHLDRLDRKEMAKHLVEIHQVYNTGVQPPTIKDAHLAHTSGEDRDAAEGSGNIYTITV